MSAETNKGGRIEGADRHPSGPSDWEAPALGTGKRVRWKVGEKEVWEKVLSIEP